MPLETITYISDFVTTNPLSSDLAATADDHLRGVKLGVKNTFPNINGAVTATDEELNFVDGVTSAIQTQLDGKLGVGANGSVSASVIFTGPVQFTGTASFAINLAVSRSESGGTVDLRVSNESNTASSRARLTTRVAGTSAEDAIVNYEISGGQQFTSGIDNSDSDTFKIQGGSSLSASAGLSITTGNVVRYDNKEVGFRGPEPNTQTGASYTLDSTDKGRAVNMTNSGAKTLTVNTGMDAGIYTVASNVLTGNITTAGTAALFLAGTAASGVRTVLPTGIITLYTVDGTNFLCAGPGVS